MADFVLIAQPLSLHAFAPFGDVIETEARNSRWINDGTCRRFDDLAEVDVSQAGGRPLISVFEATPRALPMRIAALERHPLSSQAFFPLEATPFLVVVAERGASPSADSIRAFRSSGRQGVNFRRNTWHHSLIAVGQTSRFLVIDRGGPDENCEQMAVNGTVFVTSK